MKLDNKILVVLSASIIIVFFLNGFSVKPHMKMSIFTMRMKTSPVQDSIKLLVRGFCYLGQIL